MSSKTKFIATLLCVFVVFVMLQVFFFLNRTDIARKRLSLMNQYYALMQTDPIAARRALEIMVKTDKTDQNALRELAYWYLRRGDIQSAVSQFERANQNDPSDIQSAFELGRLYVDIGQRDKARSLLMKVKSGKMPDLAEKADQMLAQLAAAAITLPTAPLPSVPAVTMPAAALATANSTLISGSVTGKVTTSPSESKPATVAVGGTMSERDKLMNDFYETKKTDPALAYQKIKHILRLYPNDVDALKEAGYYALMTLKNNALAQYYFCRVYRLTCDPKMALQLAYILSDSHKPAEAYNYFDLATHTTDLTDRMTAELAKTSMRGQQTKFLPSPYYASVDFSPLYMSRFQLLIYPIIFQLGRIMNQTYNWKVYLSYRRTSDDQSSASGQLPSIYEDDASIMAIGTSITPFPKTLPGLLAFAEIGKAKDIIYRDRARWRNDFRYGAAYYNEWGKKPCYTLKPTFMFHFNGDVYSDAIYFNRYHDGIFTFRVRPGFKVFRYGSMSLDLYYKVFLIEDMAREFYNNTLESGPGIAFMPSDRYNIVFRYESIHGHYLPASSPSTNPYRANYHNNIYEMDTYFEF